MCVQGDSKFQHTRLQTFSIHDSFKAPLGSMLVSEISVTLTNFVFSETNRPGQRRSRSIEILLPPLYHNRRTTLGNNPQADWANRPLKEKTRVCTTSIKTKPNCPYNGVMLLKVSICVVRPPSTRPALRFDPAPHSPSNYFRSFTVPALVHG